MPIQITLKPPVKFPGFTEGGTAPNCYDHEVSSLISQAVKGLRNYCFAGLREVTVASHALRSGGHVAQTYENLRPWEFPEGTKEIRHYLSLNGCTYLIGGYMDTAESNQAGAITEELFKQTVATIQLIP